MTVRHEWVAAGSASVELARQTDVDLDEADPDGWALFIGHPDGIALLGSLDELGLFLTGAAFAIAKRKAELQDEAGAQGQGTGSGAGSGPPEAFGARGLAQKALEVLTRANLSPSTRDLATLEGLLEATLWIDTEEERAALLDEILSEYEAVAVEQNDDDSIRAIVSLRVRACDLYRDSPWDTSP